MRNETACFHRALLLQGLRLHSSISRATGQSSPAISACECQQLPTSAWQPTRGSASGEQRYLGPGSSPMTTSSSVLRRAQDLLQFAALVHLHHDVRAADEFALHIQLGDGGPVAVF